MLSPPSVMSGPARSPTTVLKSPLELPAIAESPIATFEAPSSLDDRAKAPIAWLNNPVKLARRAEHRQRCLNHHNIRLERLGAKSAVEVRMPAPFESLFSSARSPMAVFAAPVIFAKHRGIANGVVAESVVLLFSAKAPNSAVEYPLTGAVSPAVKTIASVPHSCVSGCHATLSKSAAAPTAVLESAWLRASVPAPTTGIEAAGRSLARAKTNRMPCFQGRYGAGKGISSRPLCCIRDRLRDRDLVSSARCGANAKPHQNERDEKEPAPKRQRASRISSA